MLPSPGFALQQACVATLKANAALRSLLGGERIYDAPPARPPYPYVIVGPHTLRDFSSSESFGKEHIFTISAYSRSAGLREAYVLAEAISAALTSASLSLAGHHLVLFRFDTADIRREADALTSRASITFRAISEPIS
ncbi:MAG: DUF3168 domain-containing protein [Hyphomicrobiales bacterium]|nr:DUF3168 domain-containing protein [Hyphomicrobiales bacterium]OQW81970.1 MAG: hypothetical protein BVN31_09600 [Proteobacteria bacterium ST_bin15]